MKKRPKRSLARLLPFLVSLSLLSGCTKKNDTLNKHHEMSEGGFLRLNFEEGDTSSLDPMDIGSCTRGEALGKWLFEGLTRLNSKGDYELTGAESFELSPCKTRYLFTLRPNQYNNGSPVLAADYEKAWKRAIDPKSKCTKSHLLYCIKHAKEAKTGKLSVDSIGVKAIDERTLLVELVHPVDHFLSLLSMPLFAPYREKNGEILFNGPFTVDRYECEVVLDLKKNPFFWRKEEVGLNKITIFNVKSSETAFHMYRNGEIDWVGNPFTTLSEEDISSQGDGSALFKIQSFPQRIYPFWVYINTKAFPFSSASIRKAFSCVIDRREITEHIFFKRRPLFQHLPDQYSLSKDCITDCDITKGKELFEKGLEELGMTIDDFPVITISCCKLDNHKQLAEYFQEKWSKIFGIRIQLNVQDWVAFYHDLKQGNYHIGGAFFPGYYDSPLTYLEQLSEKNNFSKWHHERYRYLVSKLKTGESEDPKLFLKEAEAILKEEMPFIPILNGTAYFSYPSSLKGVCLDFKGNPDFSFAYFQEEANRKSTSLP